MSLYIVPPTFSAEVDAVFAELITPIHNVKVNRALQGINMQHLQRVLSKCLNTYRDLYKWVIKSYENDPARREKAIPYMEAYYQERVSRFREYIIEELESQEDLKDEVLMLFEEIADPRPEETHTETCLQCHKNI
jgi:hypothetical protein